MEILGKILGNPARVKIMRLFLLNPKVGFSRKDIIKRSRVNSDTLNKKTIVDNFKKAGRIKFLLVSGVFIKNKDTRVDLLIVGDKIKKSKVEEEVRKLEAEIGTELVYVVFDTKEFIYRLDMYDKLVRDILDFPHEVILQAKELSPTLILKKP